MTLVADTTSGPSVAVQAYVEIREAIISGVYRPGNKLRERELSESLNVSRIPIREALHQLESEGLITASPRRGAMVRQLCLKDIQELFDVRLSLEVLAARRAAQRAGAGADSDPLRMRLADAGRATRRGDAHSIREANTAIHAAIITLADNELLRATMLPLQGLIRWLFALTADRDPDIAYTEHEYLCSAIFEGNAELAAALAFTHIEHGRAPSLKSLIGVLPALCQSHSSGNRTTRAAV